jgi:hypothetical protein
MDFTFEFIDFSNIVLFKKKDETVYNKEKFLWKKRIWKNEPWKKYEWQEFNWQQYPKQKSPSDHLNKFLFTKK